MIQEINNIRHYIKKNKKKTLFSSPDLIINRKKCDSVITFTYIYKFFVISKPILI